MGFLEFDLSIYDSISYFQFSFQWFRLSIVVNRVEIGEKRIEINKKDLIYLYTEYFVTFSREAKYTSDFVNYRSSFFSYSGNVGKFTRSVHTRKIYIHDWRKEYEFWDGREGRRVASRNIHRRHDNTPCTRHCFD